MIKYAYMDELQEKIKTCVKSLYGLEIAPNISAVPAELAGDYACNVAMQLAGKLGKNPREIATEIVAKMSEELDAELTVAGPGFINIALSGQYLQKKLAENWTEHYGENQSGRGKVALVEFPSINIAKPYSVGHLRPGTQGWSAKRLLEANGWKVVSDNHLGDVGTPFGIWAVGFERFEKNADDVTIYDLGKIYIQMKADLKAEAEANKHELADEVQNWLMRLEAGDEEAVQLSERFKSISLKHMHEVMGRLGIATDLEMGESCFVERGKDAVKKYLAAGKFEENDDGSVICRLDEYGIDVPMLMLKSNGTALYATTDLGCLLYREEEIGADLVVYAVGAEQKFYFEQLFAMAKKLGIKLNCYHLWYGTIDQLSPEGKREKMSSRKGVVLLEDMLDDAEKRVSENFGSELEADDIKKIAVGAIKFSDFVADRKTGILYDPNKIFALTGQSGPFCQYADVRMRRILAKNADFARVDFANYDFEAEKPVLKMLLDYPRLIANVVENFEMHKIAGFCFELAQEMNRYYETAPISRADDATRSARLWLVEKADAVLAHALDLLGIEIPTRM